MRRRLRSAPTFAFWAVGLLALLLVGMALGISVGMADLSLGTVVRAIGSRLGLVSGVDPIDVNIVVELRMPRVVGAAAVGAGLAVCGAVLQSLTGNQLADPYILGMSGGAADLGCERGDPIRATGRADDVKAKAGKGFRGRGADSSARASHKGEPPGERPGIRLVCHDGPFPVRRRVRSAVRAD